MAFHQEHDGTTEHSRGEDPVLKAMREARFDTMGVSRSYLDFCLGW